MGLLEIQLQPRCKISEIPSPSSFPPLITFGHFILLTERVAPLPSWFFQWSWTPNSSPYPSSFKKNTEKHKALKKELIRRILVFYKTGKTYKYSIRKTIKKNKGRNIQKKLEKLSDKKLEKLFKSLLNKKTRKKRRR